MAANPQPFVERRKHDPEQERFRQLVEQLDDLFCPVQSEEVLCANVRKCNDKALAAETQEPQIQ